MLKKQEKKDIITSEMRWNLMNQNVLISTAMISALWERYNKDTLDLMLPFLKYAICKTTRVGGKLNMNAVVDIFKSEFGYETIPQNVIVTMLNRLSPTTLTKKDQEYTLCVSLDEEYAEFENKRTVYKERRNSVGNALADYLNSRAVSMSESFTSDSALSVLIEFFVTNGLAVAQTPEQLSLLKKEKDGKINYCIARFLIDEHKKNSVLFDYITDMVKGFFVSSAISFQPENHSLPNSKFKDLRCYLDTRVILDALGLRLESGQKAAKELLEMLQSEQATICCFEHTVEEIRDIIRAYKHSMLNPSSRVVHNTLERWDEQNVSVEHVSRYYSLLEKKIRALGIEIVSAPGFTKGKLKGLHGTKFKEQLKNRVHYNSATARKYDEDSVFAVMRLRNGRSSPELEKCGHIFATTNIPLLGVVRDCLADSVYGVEPVIADTTLSSVVWLKCSNSHKDYPVHKLVENAMLALEPTNSFLKDFYAVINQFEAEGGISADEAAIIRTDIQIRRDAVEEVCGDHTRLDKNTVVKMKENLRNRYVGEDKKASDENYKLYMAKKTQNEQALRQIIAEVEDCGDRRETRVSNFLNKAAKIVLFILLLVLVGFAVAGIVISEKYWIGAFVLLIVETIGFYDLLRGRKKFIKKYINRVAMWSAEKARAKKRAAYAAVIDTLTQDVNGST